MKCDAEILCVCLKHNRNVTPKKLMKSELLANIGCPIFNNFVRELNKYTSDKDRERKRIEFPSTTEGDR